MKKGILLVGNYPPPYGGVPRVIEDLVPCLAEKGWGVHVLSRGGGDIEHIEHGQNFTVYRSSIWPGRVRHRALRFMVEAVKRRLTGVFRLAMSLPKMHALECMSRAWIASQIVDQHDVRLVVAYNLFVGAPVGAMTSIRCNIPLITSNFGEVISNKPLFSRHVGYVKLICKLSDTLMSMTEHCAGSYRKLGISPHVEVVPVGIDIRRFSPDVDGTAIRKRLGIGQDENVVLFVGRMNTDMGLHTFLEAAPGILSARDEVKILVAGAEGPLSRDALALAEAHHGRVFVEVDIPLDEMPLYYASATLVVVPTKGDRACGSLAAAEAMATGKPVVATRVGGIPEIVASDAGILIPPEQPVVLTEQVLSLLANAELCHSMGTNGRKHAERLLDVQKTNAMHERLFSKIARS